MLSSKGPGRSRLPGQHRLGTPGLVHCRALPGIELALSTGPGHRLSSLLLPARRTWAGVRRQAVSLRQALSTG